MSFLQVWPLSVLLFLFVCWWQNWIFPCICGLAFQVASWTLMLIWCDGTLTFPSCLEFWVAWYIGSSISYLSFYYNMYILSKFSLDIFASESVSIFVVVQQKFHWNWLALEKLEPSLLSSGQADSAISVLLERTWILSAVPLGSSFLQCHLPALLQSKMTSEFWLRLGSPVFKFSLRASGRERGHSPHSWCPGEWSWQVQASPVKGLGCYPAKK